MTSLSRCPSVFFSWFRPRSKNLRPGAIELFDFGRGKPQSGRMGNGNPRIYTHHRLPLQGVITGDDRDFSLESQAARAPVDPRDAAMAMRNAIVALWRSTS